MYGFESLTNHKLNFFERQNLLKYNTKWISNGKRHHERLKIKVRDIKSSRPGVAEEKHLGIFG